jgi:hypothetical protein
LLQDEFMVVDEEASDSDNESVTECDEELESKALKRVTVVPESFQLNYPSPAMGIEDILYTEGDNDQVRTRC